MPPALARVEDRTRTRPHLPQQSGALHPGSGPALRHHGQWHTHPAPRPDRSHRPDHGGAIHAHHRGSNPDPGCEHRCTSPRGHHRRAPACAARARIAAHTSVARHPPHSRRLRRVPHTLRTPPSSGSPHTCARLAHARAVLAQTHPRGPARRHRLAPARPGAHERRRAARRDRSPADRTHRPGSRAARVDRPRQPAPRRAQRGGRARPARSLARR